MKLIKLTIRAFWNGIVKHLKFKPLGMNKQKFKNVRLLTHVFSVRRTMGEVSNLKYFLCGGFGGICTVIVGHPLDTIKVHLQTMPVEALKAPKYSGTFDCARQIVRAEGFRGLYKGMAAPLVGVSPIFAISFFGYGLGQTLIQHDSDRSLSLREIFLAGSFSGIFTTVIMSPGERIKCLLQIQSTVGGKLLYDGPIDCIRKLYRHGGIRYIYKGTLATLLRDVPASGAYFWAYEYVKKAIKNKTGHDPGILGTIMAGGSAGIANWLLGMPADVLKSRIQTAPDGRYPNGLSDAFREIIRKEGPLAFYKGITPVMLRAVPANAACFLGFDYCKKFLNWVAPDW